jgi:hypothetical protein
MGSLGDWYRSELAPRLQIDLVYAGLELRGRGPQLVARCPLHNGDDRNFTVNARTLLWKCRSQCQRGGDALAFYRERNGLGFAEAVLELAELHGLEAPATQGRRGTEPQQTTKPRREPAPVRAAALVPEKPLVYPDAREVAALWEASAALSESPNHRAYWRGRKVDPNAISDLGVMRVLRNSTPLPRWARSEDGTWRASGHGMLTLLYDAHGQVRSVCAKQRGGKSVSPAHKKRSELVMACPLAVQLLRHGTHPSTWPAELEPWGGHAAPWWPAEVRLRVVIAEGEADFETAITEARGDQDLFAPAVIGIGSGAWSDAFAARIPDGSLVNIATHPDPAGDAYARKVLESLRGRPVDVIRRHAPTGQVAA